MKDYKNPAQNILANENPNPAITIPLKDGNYKKKKERLTIIIFGVILFSCFYLFFTIAHPLYIYDTDDWTYVSYSRHAWPNTNNWNPTRILPETIMPLIAEIAVNLIMPFTKDYISSMAYAFSAVLSLTIVVYLLSFINVVKKQFDLNSKLASILVTILALIHFCPFNVTTNSSTYLLHSQNVTGYFYYVLSALVNATIVMFLMINKKIELNTRQNLFYNGFIILFIYLSINSNLFQSIILISYIGMNLLIALYLSGRGIKNKIDHFTNYIKSNIFEIIIFICWIFSCLIELQGGRAASISGKEFLLKDSIEAFIQSVKDMNKLLIFSIVIIIFTSFIIYIISIKYKYYKSGIDKTYITWIVKIIICLMFSIIYLILLCARAGAGYIKRSDVMISWMFWLFMLATISLVYIVKKFPYFMLFIPLILYILVFETVIDGHVFKENNIAGYNAQTVKELDNNITGQLKVCSTNKQVNFLIF